MEIISRARAIEIMNTKLGLPKDRFWLFDMQYCAISQDEFENVLQTIEPIKKRFREEGFDCEDFAHVLGARVRLANNYEKNIAFGEITIRHNITRRIHTLNFLITNIFDALYFDPQAMGFVNGENFNPFYARI